MGSNRADGQFSHEVGRRLAAAMMAPLAERAAEINRMHGARLAEQFATANRANTEHLADVPDALDQLSSEGAGSARFAELWDDVQTEVETLLSESAPSPVDSTRAAPKDDDSGWHISWLIFIVRASMPSARAVERFGKLISVATTALVVCSVLRAAYPSVWAELEKLHLTPFEFVAFVLGLLAWLTAVGARKTRAAMLGGLLCSGSV